MQNCPAWAAHEADCILKDHNALPLLVAPLILMARVESGLEPFPNETVRFLRRAHEYVTKESYAFASAASSSSTYAPTSRAAASASGSSHQTPPTAPKILRLEFYKISGEKVEVKTPLTSIKHARQAHAEIFGENSSSIKLFTEEGHILKDDSPVPEVFSNIQIAISYWTGDAKLLSKYQHSTDLFCLMSTYQLRSL